MNLADHYRTTIEDLTDDRPGGPDLATSVAAGRRRRRTRRIVVAGGAIAALTVVGTVGAWTHRPPKDEIARPGFAAAPAYQDFVPGSDVDETIQATVAAHLTGVPAATKVYPSDWNHDTPIPDARAQDATDWEAYYGAGSHESLAVLIGKKIPGEPSRVDCTTVAADGGPICSTTDLGGGAEVTTYGFRVTASPQSYWFVTVHVSADGSSVDVSQRVEAGSWAEAADRLVFSDAQTVALANDPAMTFPDPQQTPPPPTS